MDPMSESTLRIAESVKDAVSGKRVSRAFTGTLILRQGIQSLSSSRTSSTASSRNSSRVGTPPCVLPQKRSVMAERCSCCKMDDFWIIYDSFRLMDKRGCGLVRRCDFYEASTEHVTLNMRRTMARANLHQRFRSNAGEMTLQELVQLVWPNASETDKRQMSDWAKLRDAWALLTDPDFQGTREDLKKVFDLLNIEGDDMLSISDLVRSRILTKVESQNLLRQWYKAFNKASDDSGSESGIEPPNSENLCLSFNEFCQMTQKHLCEKYVQKDDENTSWETSCRSAFLTSRTAVAKLMAARESCEFAPSREV